MIADAPHRSSRGSEAAWPHHALLLAFVLLWGGNFVLAEVALREMAPISFSVSRFLMGGWAMIGVLYLQIVLEANETGSRNGMLPRLRREDWPRLLIVSVIGATLAPWLGIEGLGLTHGARASLWLALGPVLSCLIGYALRTERLGWAGFAGVLLAALGTVALAVDGLRPGQNYWVGDVLLCIALLMAVAELHFIKPLAARYGATPMVTARTAIGGFVYLIIASPSLVHEPWLSLDAWTWIAIVFGGAVGVGLGQWVKVRALRKLGPTRVVLYGNLVPLAALWLAWLTIGTEPSPLEIIAGFLIVIGAICIQIVDSRSQTGRGRRRAADEERRSAQLFESVAFRSGDP